MLRELPEGRLKVNNMKKFSIIFLFFISVLMIVGCSSTSLYKKGTVVNDNRVFYEIFVPSYYDSDQDKVGDFRGILEKLDYLNKSNSSKDLGVTGIWLMPIMKSPSYHKYDVQDYYSVDPSYGTIEDFRALAYECKIRDIALIIDLTLNHSSSQNPWFIAACNNDDYYRDYYNFSPIYKSGYHKSPVSNEYYEGHFSSSMPDFNLDSEKVRNEILKICQFWINQGVSGFRLDAVSHFYEGNQEKNVEFLSWLYKNLKTMKEDIYLVGEAWESESVILRLYESNLPSLFNFPLSQSTGFLISSIRTSSGKELSSRLESWYSKLSSVNIDAPFLTNHDQARSAGALSGNEYFTKMAASIYLLLPGNPFVYYGEEIGMKGGSSSDEDKRTQFVWSVKENTKGMCIPPKGAVPREIEAGEAEQSKDQNSLLSFYRRIIQIKNENPGLSEGVFKALDFSSSSICAYKMEDINSSYIVIHNLDNEETIKIEDLNYTKKIGVISCTGEEVKIENNSVTLPPFSTIVLLE